MTLVRRTAPFSLFLLCATFSFSCARFNPPPMDTIPFKERAQTQERGGLKVSVAVPSRDEAKRGFGVDVADKHIQPVWIRIENNSEMPYVLMLHAVDPAYYAAREAAYGFHKRLRFSRNKKIDRHFASLGMNPVVLPGGVTEGFVFSHLKLGTKEVRVKLQGPKHVQDFEFYARVPGFTIDHHEVNWEALLAKEFTDYEDEESFRKTLADLPCCTTRITGGGKGDPINLVFIGSKDDVASALIRSGWDETEKLTFRTAMRTFRAFFGGQYKYSPMSPLYFFGRSHDAGYQKARDTIRQRNHLRLWLSPLQYKGKHVWVGTITRDIGVYFTWRTWRLTNHAVDPNVDEARRYLREDFAIAEAIQHFGHAKGVGAATPEKPHRNLMGAHWWTDGLRLVVELSEQPVPLVEQGFFYWDWPVPDSEEINRELREFSE